MATETRAYDNEHGGTDFTEDPHGTYERFCDWPGCDAVYHVVNGAKDGKPWKRNRRVLLCPDHAAAGHWPDLTHPLPAKLAAKCSCGEVLGSGESPATLHVLTGWWQQHVATLPQGG